MKTIRPTQTPDESGSALAMTMIMTTIALAILASAMSWSATSTALTHRSIQYTKSVAAAEAGTEKVFSRMTRDYLSGGEKLVSDNLASYRTNVPTAAESAFWSGWEFNDGNNNLDRTFVQRSAISNYVVLNSTFSGLRGFVSTYSVVAHARQADVFQNVMGGVLQEVRLVRIPIFQFALYSSGDMEISCGQAFNVTGLVHANRRLFVEPDSTLTFKSDVTAVNGIAFARHPLDTRGSPAGSAVYEANKKPDADAMTLPIGVTNTPEAIRAIIQLPPTGEDPNSTLGRSRYYNQTDLIVTVSNSGIYATSGRFNNMATEIPHDELATMVTITNSFRDARESKTVRPVDINVAALAIWSQTNTVITTAFSTNRLNVSSVYVVDHRVLASGNLGAVRVVNGLNLPASGLTVATARPLYVLGHYNQTNSANLGKTNTITTRPASLVADAVTILSEGWLDSRSTNALASRVAAPTTVNAAILTGVVETTLGKYSGGMENFPRFLEAWGAANIFTYNGSMVKMFPSLYATNAWGTGGIYDPPKRNWAFDLNFNDPAKLPPLTPSLVQVKRGRWATVPPDRNTVAAVP